MSEDWLDVRVSASLPSGPMVRKEDKRDVNAHHNAFAQALQRAQNTPNAQNSAKPVTISAHASERLRSRGVHVSEQTMRDLSRAADTLAQKNAKESLVVVGTVGYVLSVPNRTVVTAMRLDEGEPSVITNIDSAMVVSR